MSDLIEFCLEQEGDSVLRADNGERALHLLAYRSMTW
jgi:CheY-like chemotaxis protein